MNAKHNLNKRHAGTYGTQKIFARESGVLIDQVIHRLFLLNAWKSNQATKGREDAALSPSVPPSLEFPPSTLTIRLH
jgi:hypothetical protein